MSVIRNSSRPTPGLPRDWRLRYSHSSTSSSEAESPDWLEDEDDSPVTPMFSSLAPPQMAPFPPVEVEDLDDDIIEGHDGDKVASEHNEEEMEDEEDEDDDKEYQESSDGLEPLDDSEFMDEEEQVDDWDIVDGPSRPETKPNLTQDLVLAHGIQQTLIKTAKACYTEVASALTDAAKSVDRSAPAIWARGVLAQKGISWERYLPKTKS